MTRLLNLFGRHPWLTIGLLLLVTALFGSQLSKIQIQVSADELLVKNDPDRDFYRHIGEKFGDEQVSLLYLEDDSLLSPSKLTALKKVITELEALPFVKRTESLFSVPHLRTVDGYLVKDPYLDVLPSTPEAEQTLLDQALISPFLKHVLLSTDRRHMAVAIFLMGDHNDTEITSGIDTITAQLEGHYQRTFTIGFPYVRAEISEKIAAEQGELIPLAIGALLIALFLLLRQVVDILIPVMTAAISIVWTLGAMAFMGIPLNVVTSIVPVLLIIVGSTEDIHLLSEFRHGQRIGLSTERALRLMSEKMGRTIVLTFITTYFGFLAVGLSRIEVLWEFGLVASTGLLLNFIATVTLIPALLALTGQWQLDGRPGLSKPDNMKFAEGYWAILSRNQRPVMIVFAAVTLFAAVGIPNISLNHNTIDSLNEDSVVRLQFEEVNQRLAGLESFSIIIDSGIDDTFLKARYLEELVKIQSFLTQQGQSRSSTSFANYLALLNAAFEEVELPRMPDSDEVVNELMIFLNYDHVKAYVSEDYRTARILVRHNISATEPLQGFIDDLQTFLDAHLDSGLQARITGDSVLTLSATRAMIFGQLQSILLLVLMIIVIVSLLFADFKVGLLATIPNIFPVVILFGYMGYAGIPLNIGTTMAAAIAIGIAVDDTMHFMLRYNRELKNSKSQLRAINATIFAEALPVLATSIALIAGFLVFSQSDFKPIAQFGQLSALVIFAALIADFIITPITISSLRLITLWDLLSLQLREEVIRKSLLFKGMEPRHIRRFILSSTLLKYEEDEVIFKEGDPSEAMFMVMTGKVEIRVTKSANDSEACALANILPQQTGGTFELTIETFGPGDIFGDVALLANKKRHTHAIAKDGTSVLLLTRETIATSTARYPAISARLFLNLSTHISQRFLRLVSSSSGIRK